MHTIRIFAGLLAVFFYSSSLRAQIIYRIEAEISIKEIRSDGTQSLMIGKVYYDKNIRQIIYNITFPDSTRFAITDRGVLNKENPKGKNETPQAKQLVDFSVFHLFLNQELNYFGLENTPFKMTKVEREGDMVISEWQLPEEMGQNLGKMLVSQKNKQLYGLVTLGPDDVLMSKQFFSDYIPIDGMFFPSKIIQLNYSLIGENKKITTFRHVKLNQYTNESNYRFFP